MTFYQVFYTRPDDNIDTPARRVGGGVFWGMDYPPPYPDKFKVGYFTKTEADVPELYSHVWAVAVTQQ